MFLRGKKPEGNLVKKQSQDQQLKSATKPKALGGWEDDQDTQNPQPAQQENGVVSITHSEEPATTSIQPNKKDEFRLYSTQQLSEQTNLEYETKLVNDITQPGGIRVKPNDNLLIEFSKAAKTLDVPIIGSLLISRLELDYPYALKAKTLYTIEYISKKIDKYQAYFKRHSDYIRNLPMPEDNQQQYQTLFEDTMNLIQGVEKSNKIGSEGLLEFTDPGYNVPQKVTNQGSDIMSGERPVIGLMSKASDRAGTKVNKGPTKTFISPEELKKKKLLEENKKTETVSILESSTPPQKIQQPAKIDIFSLEGLRLDDKPVVPIIPQVSAPTTSQQHNQSGINQQYNMYHPGQNPGFMGVPQTAPQGQQLQGYNYGYQYQMPVVAPMQPPTMPMMPLNYGAPAYQMNNGQYPVGGYNYGTQIPNVPGGIRANPQKEITGANLYSMNPSK